MSGLPPPARGASHRRPSFLPAYTRIMTARRLAQQHSALRSIGTRSLHVARICQDSKSPARSGPTFESRISPQTGSTPAHPGYTPADTPVTSAHPSTMPGPSSTAKVSG